MDTGLEFSVLYFILCFSSTSVLILLGINDKLQKGGNKLSFIKIYFPSLMFFVINLPLVIFNSDFSECKEVLLCIFFFVCVYMQTGSLQFEMFSGVLSQILRKAASFGASDVFN